MICECTPECCAGVGELQGQPGDQPGLHMRAVAAAAQPGGPQHATGDRGGILDGCSQVRSARAVLQPSWGMRIRLCSCPLACDILGCGRMASNEAHGVAACHSLSLQAACQAAVSLLLMRACLDMPAPSALAACYSSTCPCMQDPALERQHEGVRWRYVQVPCRQCVEHVSQYS